MSEQPGHVGVDPDLLPILGEPFAVELANTLYNRPGAAFDFFGSGTWMAAWFEHIDTGTVSRMPRRVDRASADEIRSIRNAIHAVFTDTTSHRQPSAATIATFNNAADRVGWRVRLEWSKGTAPVVSTTALGRGFDASIASIGIECMTFVASPLLPLVRRCEGPDCPMFFVQQHHKRRFCHDGCAHRARQSRYYRNHRQLVHASRSSLHVEDQRN